MTARLPAQDKEERRKWRGIWRYILQRTIVTEPAAKHAALLALQWLERDAKRRTTKLKRLEDKAFVAGMPSHYAPRSTKPM